MSKVIQVVYKCDRCRVQVVTLNGELPERWETVKEFSPAGSMLSAVEICGNCVATLHDWFSGGGSIA